MKRPRLPQTVETICRLGLGALFIYSALAKISDPGNFANTVNHYRILPYFTIGIFSLAMPMLELLAGLTIVFTKWLRESALLITGMLALFIVALVQALFRGLEISCGCFGVPSVGGREEILMALIRDVVLIVPAAWLMFRQNARIEPLNRLTKGWHMACLCGFGMLLAAWFMRDTWISGGFAPSLSPEPESVSKANSVSLSIETNDVQKANGKRQNPRLLISTGPIRPGEWNADFEGVLAKSEREQRPMVLLRVNVGCEHCSRLEESISGTIFRLWREDRAPLMAFVQGRSQLSPRKTVKASDDFVHKINKHLMLPYVCVYWPQSDTTNHVAFSGRRGMMGGQRDKLLVVELMSALDLALGKRLTTGRKTLESLVRAATVRISAQAEGGGGTVAMTPESGLLPEGGEVTLTAQPNAGYAFLDWRHPDGSLASIESSLIIRGDMSAGCYTARFKSRSKCPPPLLISPAETSICVKVGERFSHAILVDESCRPVKFMIKQHSKGISVNPVTGVLSGRIQRAMTNTVEIAVIGYDPDQTEKTVRLTIESIKQRFPFLRRRGVRVPRDRKIENPQNKDGSRSNHRGKSKT